MYDAAGECRRHVPKINQNCKKVNKNAKITIIWIHYEKYIKISTSLTRFCVVICEIGVEFKEFRENKTVFCIKNVGIGFTEQKCVCFSHN